MIGWLSGTSFGYIENKIQKAPRKDILKMLDNFSMMYSTSPNAAIPLSNTTICHIPQQLHQLFGMTESQSASTDITVQNNVV